MKNITVTIDDIELAKLDLTSNPISYVELKEKISIEFAKEAFLKCNQIAAAEGLSTLTLAEINEEIKAVRNAKNNH